MFICLITLCFCFLYNTLSPRKSTEEDIIGIWKHHKDQVFLIFWENHNVSLRIPLNYEVKGQFKFINKHIVEIVFFPLFFLSSGEEIRSEPQLMRLTIDNYKLLLYGIEKYKDEGELFTKVQ